MSQANGTGGSPAAFFRIAACLSSHSGKNPHIALLAAAAERVGERIARERP